MDRLVLMRVVYKIWLDNNGIAFGKGPYRLLLGIKKTGSLRQAALAMEMTYTKALHIIACCERTLGFALARRKIGGLFGGRFAADAPGNQAHEEV